MVEKSASTSYNYEFLGKKNSYHNVENHKTLQPKVKVSSLKIYETPCQYAKYPKANISSNTRFCRPKEAKNTTSSHKATPVA